MFSIEMISHWLFNLLLWGLGLITLLTFLYSMYKPSKIVKRYILALLGLLAFMALCFWANETGRFSFKDHLASSFMIFALPPLAVLLISLSGIRALVDHGSSRWASPLSSLNAAGCIGLTYGLAILYIQSSDNLGGVAIILDAFIGGGIAGIIATGYAIRLWKNRFAQTNGAASR